MQLPGRAIVGYSRLSSEEHFSAHVCIYTHLRCFELPARLPPLDPEVCRCPTGLISYVLCLSGCLSYVKIPEMAL